MSDIPDSDLEILARDLEKKADRSMSMVSFNDLFTTSFMTTYTQFSNFKDLLDAGKFNVNSLQDFTAILDDKFDVFLNKTTKFPTWEKMQSTAIAEYLKRKESKQ